MSNPSLPRLSQKTLASVRDGVSVPTYDRSKIGIGIVHFGPGAFHRGHQAWYVDRLLAKDPRWGISEVELKGRGIGDGLKAQDNLYAIGELDRHPRFHVVGSIKEFLTAEHDADAIFARLVDPKVKIVSSTVTEKGYCLDGKGSVDVHNPDIAHDLKGPAIPASIVGWLVAGLERRRAKGVKPFVVLSCDNVVDNGKKVRGAVLGFTEAAGKKELADWIAKEVRFPCTMVDSITPATTDEVRHKVADGIGLIDQVPVQRESFVQWVIEDILGDDAPDYGSVGADMTRDVAAYEQAKLRLLNGAHSTLAYTGLLLGHKSVGEAMTDLALAGFVEKMMREDIMPTLRSVAGFDLAKYITDVLQRFRNPALTHLLYQIASDGSQKLPFRILGTITDVLKAGRQPGRLAVPVAAWMRFVEREAKAGRSFNDPMSDGLIAIGKSCTGAAATDLPKFFKLDAVFAPAIVADGRFVKAIGAAYDRFPAGTLLQV